VPLCLRVSIIYSGGFLIFAEKNMENILKYKNFIATVAYSSEDDVFFGRIAGLDSVVSFEGQSVDELKSAFAEAVESYLDFRRRNGFADAEEILVCQ
jgi:predicted HicB family RNase H-like nuclease